MPGNPAGSKWRSASRKRRHRIAPSWTISKAMIAHVAAEAEREDVTASALVERALVAHLGEAPPLPPEDEEDPAPETVKENRPVASR